MEAHTLPPVLLFHGPLSTPKYQFAEELAFHLLGASGSKNAGESHPDLHQLIPDKNGLHSITSIREFIAETMLPPFTAKAKVFIIHHAEKMLATSSNALLKTLEEPPSATWIILLVSDISAILPTILSRCCVMAFRQKASLLQDHDPKTDPLLEILSSSLFGEEKSPWFPLFQRLEESLKEIEKDESAPLEGKGQAFLSTLMYWMRDLCLLQSGGDPAHIFYQAHMEVLQRQAQTSKPLSFPKVYALLDKAQARLASNMRLSVVLEECLLKIQLL